MDVEFDTIIDRATSGALTDEEIAALAERLAASGERLPMSDLAADLASTGGPGSLSTMWGPAALVALGCSVPKLGVPGRPAGGVDSLAQVPGYRVQFDRVGVEAVLDRCRYVHVVAGTQFAPADAAFFAHRQRVGAQSVPALAIASLLSKKLAMGVQTVGLEVRVAPHGNFGATPAEASENARRFCRVASLVNVTATCFLADGTAPQQPYLGRGEALLALSLLFAGKASGWLERHAAVCEAWAATLVRPRRPSRLALAHAFASNLSAQGGSVDGLEEVATRVARGHCRVVAAERGGIVEYDLGRLRSAITTTRIPDTAGNFDDSAGAILLAEPGRPVLRGDALISARCPDDAWPAFAAGLAEAVSFAGSEERDNSDRLAGTLEVVRV